MTSPSTGIPSFINRISAVSNHFAFYETDRVIFTRIGENNERRPFGLLI